MNSLCDLNQIIFVLCYDIDYRIGLLINRIVCF